MKKILFVTYGGGHVMMVAPVVRALAAYPDIETETLALTLGGVYFKGQGLPYKGYKDFITHEDKEALNWGKELAARYHKTDNGMDENEAIAYLGLSYWDLVLRHGETQAAQLWKTHQRNAFLPLTVMERIITQLQPDMVVTTNSPRSERAAILVANKLGISTMSMVDLFGISYHILEANTLTVLSPRVIENIKKDVGIMPGQKFLITGNPAFDQALEYGGTINYAWRKSHFPALPEHAKTLLWIDDYGYFDEKSGRTHIRTEEEITKDFDALAHAAQVNNAYLLIRPHPSQDKTIFETWVKTSMHPHVLFAGDVPLYPLLNACDAVIIYQSTVGLEALMMQRPVIQLQYYPVRNGLPLGDWGVARLVKTPGDLPEIVRQTFADENFSTIQARIDELLPKEKAAPKIAAAIHRIVCG